MEKEEIKPEIVTRYLLGDLPEAEKARVEDAFLGDERFFEQVLDAENDLVDAYVGGRLKESERAAFENYYLALPEKREKVAAAKLLQRRNVANAAPASAAETKPVGSLRQFFRTFFGAWQFAPVAALVLIILIGGLWLALRPPSPPEIAFSPNPTPTVLPAAPAPTISEPPTAVSPAPTPQTAPPPERSPVPPTPTPQVSPTPEMSPIPRQTPRPSPPPVFRTVTLALVGGGVRGGAGGGENKLVLPETAQTARLVFSLPEKKYAAIEARIETVAGENVWRGGIRQTAGRVSLSIPARLFADEDYLLIVSGENEAGNREDFLQFYFNAARSKE